MQQIVPAGRCRLSAAVILLFPLLLAAAGEAQNAATAPATNEATPAAAPTALFQVVDLMGGTHSGRLLRLVPEITLADDRGEAAFGWADILEIHPLSPPAHRPLAATGWRIELAEGSILFGSIAAEDAGRLSVALAGGQEVKIGLGDASSLLRMDANEGVHQVFTELAAAADAVDDAVILLKGADSVVLRGNVTQWSAAQLHFHWKDRDLPIPWDKIAAVVLGRPRPAEQPAILHFDSGARLAGRVAGGDDTAVEFDTPSLGRRVVPWAQVDRIEVRSARMAFLSDLPPRLYEFTPFLEQRWEPAFDRTLPGNPIVLGGRTYAKGVSMHSQSRLIYAINRSARQFAATVGIADEMGPRGAVDLMLVGDGQTLWEARGVRGGEPPREVLVDVASVEVLELRVEFGEDLDLSDQVCWAFARLIR